VQVLRNPKVLLPYLKLGDEVEVSIVDVSRYAAVGEPLSYWQLMKRAQLCGQCLLGYYEVPDELDEPLRYVLNPVGAEARREVSVWSTGGLTGM
jgi:hypothetical protein